MRKIFGTGYINPGRRPETSEVLSAYVGGHISREEAEQYHPEVDALLNPPGGRNEQFHLGRNSK